MAKNSLGHGHTSKVHFIQRCTPYIRPIIHKTSLDIGWSKDENSQKNPGNFSEQGSAIQGGLWSDIGHRPNPMVFDPLCKHFGTHQIVVSVGPMGMEIGGAKPFGLVDISEQSLVQMIEYHV